MAYSAQAECRSWVSLWDKESPVHEQGTVNKALCCHFSAHNSHEVLLNHFHVLTDEYIHCSNEKGLRIYGILNKSQNAE